MAKELTTYEKCKAIRDGLVRRAADVMTYKSWPDDFATKEIRNFPDDVLKMENGKQYYNINPNDLTVEQAKELGFRKWSEENPIWLIPLYLLPFLADEIQIGCIDDEPVRMKKKSEMGNDNRFGCLAYGVKLEVSK